MTLTFTILISLTFAMDMARATPQYDCPEILISPTTTPGPAHNMLMVDDVYDEPIPAPPSARNFLETSRGPGPANSIHQGALPPTLSLPQYKQALATLDRKTRKIILGHTKNIEHFKGLLSEALNPFLTAGIMNSRSIEGELSPYVVKKMAGFVILCRSDFVGAPKGPLTRDTAIADQSFSGRTGQSLSSWVNTADEALFAYQHIEDFGPRADRVFEWLIKHNVYFKNVRPVKGSKRTVQTFSYEKETPANNPLIGYYWRPSTLFSVTQWERMPEPERLYFLDFAIRKGLPLVPTNILVTKYAKLELEMLGGFEFIHPSYEIDLDRLKTTAIAIAKDMGETHSFHFHQVFELDQNGDQSKFLMWHKIKDDYALLLGMESKFQPKEIIAATPIPRSGDSFASPGKNHSLGVRVQIYGAAKDSAKRIRVGIETRDVLRDLNRLFRVVIEPNADEIERLSWEHETAPHPDEISKQKIAMLEVPTLDSQTLPKESHDWRSRLFNLGVTNSNLLDLILENDPYVAMAAQPFESYRYYNYRDNRYYEPRPDEALRIQSARQYYLKELKELNDDVTRHQRMGTPHEDQDILYALKFIRATWARAARVSELYRY